MRPLIFATNLSLDGCCDHTRQLADDETHEYFTELLRGAGTLLYGRKTYELMVPYWPEVAKSQSMSKALNEFARVFDSLEKIVFSRSLASVKDSKTRILRESLRDEVMKLKQAPGKPILAGGVDLPSQLLQFGLIDEFRFVVHPVIAGEGRRLFDNLRLAEPLRLKLAGSRQFRSGSAALRYIK